ncbi:MAG: hypothetical protein ACOVNL_11370 [Prochlorococcaceae cyanobacterium]
MNAYSQPLRNPFPRNQAKAFKAFLTVSFVATFTIYLLLITSHLFYGRTYLLDTGFWIGLSTGNDPTQLIEPSGINNDIFSYFNTHYSPIYSALQIIYSHVKDLIQPAGFFLLWFTAFHVLTSGMFALALSLAIERVLAASSPRERAGSTLVATALAGCYWLSAGSNAYFISYASYPHTEIIGLQLIYIGLFMLILACFLPFSPSDPPDLDRPIAATALLLMLLGSLFHELVALISLFNLTVFLLTGNRLLSRTGRKRTWIRRRIAITMGMIGLPLLSWALLRRHGYFMGTFTSSLKRIYVGDNFDHLSLGRYLTAIKEASAENASALIVLLLTLALSLYLARRGLYGFLLYLIIPIGYFIASPAAVNDSAATLTAHYGYLLASAFYLFPITLAVAKNLPQPAFSHNFPKNSLPGISTSGRLSVKLMLILPLVATIGLTGISMHSLLRKKINSPYPCTPTSTLQDAQQDTCISQPRVSNIWFRPGFIFEYVNLGLHILRRAENTLTKLGQSSGKANYVFADEQLATLYPNRFPRDNVLASEEQIALYQNKLFPKGSHYIRYHITDSLYSKDIIKLLAKNRFRLVTKTKVGDFGSGTVYEYIWANNVDGAAAN